MRIVLLLIVLGVIAWFVMGRKPAEKPAPASSPSVPVAETQPTPKRILTPEEEADALVAQPSVKVDELVQFCQKYPQAQKLLFARNLNLSGTIKKVGIFGMQEDQGEISLASDQNRTVVLEYKIDRAAVTKDSSKLIVKGNELLFASGAGNTKSLGTSGATINTHASVKSVTPASIRLVVPLE